MNTSTNPPAVNTHAPAASSTSSSTYSSYIELESQLILRMPYKKEPNGMVRLHPATATLREILEKINSGEVIDQDPLKDRLFIQLDPETRKGRVKFDEEIFEARLVDLPCIIESHKTLDKKAFFKTADISQMLVCKTQDDPWTLSDEEIFNEHNRQLRKLGKLKKKYQWPHGITPPLKNVRKKRFRKLNRKKTLDYDDIEKELRELFKQDREAIRTEYEVIYLDRDPDDIEEEDDDDDDFAQQGRKRASRPSYHLHPIAEFEDKDGSSRPDSMSNTNSRPAMPARRASRVTSRGGDGSNLSASDATVTMSEKASNKQPADLSMTQEETSEKREMLESGEDSTMDTKKPETAQDSSTKARTNFKNLFVKDVIGDLSSSDESDEGDDEDEDDDDYDENSKSKGPGTSKTRNPQSSTRFFTHDEDSMSNFDRSTRNYDDDEEEEEDENSRVASKSKELTTKSLFGESDENDSDAPETEDDEDEEVDTFDEDDDEKTRGSEMSKPRTSQTAANLAYDLSLSSSDHNNTELEASQQQQQADDHLTESLNKLMNELAKIQEDRKKREIDVQAINNPVLKARLSSTLNNLIEEENRKLDEIAQIKSMMNK